MNPCRNRRTRAAAAVLLAGLVAALHPRASFARTAAFYDVTLDLGLRDDTRIFLNVTNDYFAPPAVAVDLVKRCPAPEDDYPVILLLARASRRPPGEILALRLEYLSWSDIMLRLRVSPSILFAGLNRDPGPPYGRAWGYWKKHPKGEFRFRDRDVVELAKLQVAAGYHHVSPYTIIAQREKGVTVERYVAEKNRGKYPKQKSAARKGGRGSPPSGKDQGTKEHGKPRDRG